MKVLEKRFQLLKLYIIDFICFSRERISTTTYVFIFSNVIIWFYGSCIQDVALAALFVSTKMHDTLKKPRELLAVSYAVRFPEFAAKSKHPAGEVDLDTMDAQVTFFLVFDFLPTFFFDSFNNVDG